MIKSCALRVGVKTLKSTILFQVADLKKINILYAKRTDSSPK